MKVGSQDRPFTSQKYIEKNRRWSQPDSTGRLLHEHRKEESLEHTPHDALETEAGKGATNKCSTNDPSVLWSWMKMYSPEDAQNYSHLFLWLISIVLLPRVQAALPWDTLYTSWAGERKSVSLKTKNVSSGFRSKEDSKQQRERGQGSHT